MLPLSALLHSSESAELKLKSSIFTMQTAIYFSEIFPESCLCNINIGKNFRRKQKKEKTDRGGICD